LYRDVREYAVGHGIAAMWSPEADGAVESVRTDWLPQVSVKDTSAEGHERLSNFLVSSPDTLGAGWLAREPAREEITGALEGFAACYGSWIEAELEQRLAAVSSGLQQAATRNLTRCRDTLARIRLGIEVLRTNDLAWRAFCLANAAMDRQSRFPAKGDRAGPLVWRPFQLAYQLMVMPGLVAPAQYRDDRRIMDLLWFPTGGGKTEAYLGLTAFVIFFRRLSDARHAAAGAVDVLMRYTLRLLTVQQFQRAASLVTSC
jgi:hypothetical protein